MAKDLPFVSNLKIADYKGIGRIIFSGALLEFSIAAVIINALGINRKEGRATIIPQTARANLDLLLLIGKNRGLKGAELARLRKLTVDISDNALHYRNVIAHGVWQYDREERTIGVTSYRGGTEKKRALVGDRYLVKDNTLNIFNEVIKSWHWEFLAWVDEHEALLFPPPDKRGVPGRETILRPDGIRPKHPLRLQSSGG